MPGSRMLRRLLTITMVNGLSREFDRLYRFGQDELHAAFAAAGRLWFQVNSLLRTSVSRSGAAVI